MYMRDLNGNLIEIGDSVAFPGPYGQTLVVGVVEKVGIGHYNGGVGIHKVKVRLEGGGKTYWGREITHRDYWGNPANDAYGDNPTKGIIILNKGS